MSEDTSRKSNLEGTTVVTEGRNRRRSQRVALRLPVLVSAIIPGGKRISIEVQTLVVNAHGGLLDVGMELVRGQQICLSYLKTEISSTGRAVRIEGSEGGRFLIAFEFDFPAPHFWPVRFWPASWSSVQSGF